VLGADVELGNFILGDDAPGGTGAAASRCLLEEVRGVVSGPFTDPQDMGRRFLPTNGGCIYIDLDHLEVALPETTSAFDHVAYWRAMLHVARDAATRANRRMPAGRRIEVVANNSDGLGHSYGSHVSVLLSRAAWDTIISRKSHFLAFLSAFQVSSVIYTGQGKVGSENSRPPVDYQLSQRADFIETLTGFQTTHERPIVNTRDEPLCGSTAGTGRGLARLHVIFFDSTLCDTASLLRAGTLQIVVAMLEAGWVNPSLALDDPLEALQTWSRDPSLDARSRTVSGGWLTAVDLQFRFLKEAQKFAGRGGCDGIVPRAAEILALWEDTLTRLRNRDFGTLARRLDWVLKRQMLERALAQRPDLTWTSPEIKHLDHLYASLDDASGLFRAYENAGRVDRFVTDEDVERAVNEPPGDTRAWTRAHLLRRAGSDGVEHVDWDRVTINLVATSGGCRWLRRRVVALPSPFGSHRAANEEAFGPDRTVEEIVAALQPSEDDITDHHVLGRIS
jgi:proteasome accessory factor A